MNQNRGPIGDRFASLDSNREQILETARVASALTDKTVLPPREQEKNGSLPEPFQSVGAWGVLNMKGRLLSALFPPANPWFELRLPADIAHNPAFPPELIRLANQQLFLWEIVLQSLLETAGSRDNRGSRRASFYARKGAALGQLIVTGDVLEHQTDDFRHVVYRRDQYVTKRDSSCDVLMHVIHEKLDPLSLDDDMLAKAEFDMSEFEDMDPGKRMVDVYTNVEWQPQSRVWSVALETNGNTIFERDEKVPSYFGTAYSLAPGEDYGRGFVEVNVLASLKTLNNLEIAILDMAGLAADQKPATDRSCQASNDDLTGPPGTLVRNCRVEGGVVQDVGVIKYEVVRELQMITQAAERAGGLLSRAFLSELGTTRDAERVTAFERQRAALELNGALGGVFAPLADDQQLPLLNRTLTNAYERKLLPVMPQLGARLELDMVEVQTLTGLTQLVNESKKGDMVELAQIAAQLGPEAQARINPSVMLEVYAKRSGMYEAGLVRTQKETDDILRRQQQAALQQAAGEEAVSVAGDVVRSAAEQPAA